MKTENYPKASEGAENQSSLADIVREWEEACKNCHPLTPMMCMTSCKIWGSKNQLRKLYEKTKNADFMSKLLNTLKNKRRLKILEIISNGQHSIYKLQQELKKRGHSHSQRTIAEEYMAPLIDVGLAEENANHYCITLFGRKVIELTKISHNFGDVLPPHSECYEETILLKLSKESKTFDDLKTAISTKNVARLLNRLYKARLIETTKENDYVFYFKTKRDSNKTKFSPTERRIYEIIPKEGIPAKKLAEKTMISLRRTYKYLRRLKGKKMVFARKRPKSYMLTAKGFQIASMLKKMHKLTAEILTAPTQYVKDQETRYIPMPDTSSIMQGDKQRK